MLEEALLSHIFLFSWSNPNFQRFCHGPKRRVGADHHLEALFVSEWDTSQILTDWSLSSPWCFSCCLSISPLSTPLCRMSSAKISSGLLKTFSCIAQITQLWPTKSRQYLILSVPKFLLGLIQPRVGPAILSKNATLLPSERKIVHAKLPKEYKVETNHWWHRRSFSYPAHPELTHTFSFSGTSFGTLMFGYRMAVFWLEMQGTDKQTIAKKLAKRTLGAWGFEEIVWSEIWFCSMHVLLENKKRTCKCKFGRRYLPTQFWKFKGAIESENLAQTT